MLNLFILLINFFNNFIDVTQFLKIIESSHQNFTFFDEFIDWIENEAQIFFVHNVIGNLNHCFFDEATV